MTCHLVATPPQESLDQARCNHHWVIEAASGPESGGVCQICGEVKQFKNYIESAPWEEKPSASSSHSEAKLLASQNDTQEEHEES